MDILENLDKITDHITELEAIKQAAIDVINALDHPTIRVDIIHGLNCVCGNCNTDHIQLNFKNLIQLLGKENNNGNSKNDSNPAQIISFKQP